MTHGKQIRLFLTDGSPTGFRYAELVNWTGHAFACPKGLLTHLSEWTETQRPGVYVLFGTNQAGNTVAYIGESENVAKRLLQHVARATLDEITEVLFFTSKDDNLTKGHITYLEERLYRRACSAKQYEVYCGREPSEKKLSRPEEAAMVEFLDNIYIVSGALGFDVFEQRLLPQLPDANKLFYLSLRDGIEAAGFPMPDGFMVRAGSTASVKNQSSMPDGYTIQKDRLKDAGTLVLHEQHLRFTQDYLFKSSSAAACVVAGTARSGPQSWMREGITLRDFEFQQANKEQMELGKTLPVPLAEVPA